MGTGTLGNVYVGVVDAIADLATLRRAETRHAAAVA
jgi:hypothetical protein